MTLGCCITTICACERLGDRRRVVGRATDVTAADVVLADAADVEPDVVAGFRLRDFFVVHLDGLDLAADVDGWNETLSPVLSIPVSTRPTGTVPMPEMV